MILGISVLLGKYVCTNLPGKFSAVNFLKSGVVICLLCSGILFLTTVKAVVLAYLLILGILFLTPFLLALRVALVAKLVIPGISSSISLILTLHTSFSLQHYFLLQHLVFLNQQDQVVIQQHLFYFSNCLNYLVHLSIDQYLIHLHQISNQLNHFFFSKI